MNRLLALIAALACLASSAVSAHPFTVKGTVVSADPARITVNVRDEETKKTEVRKYAISETTVVLRGDTVVTFAAAKIQKGEPVAVTVNIDDRDDWAEVIRLGVRK